MYTPPLLQRHINSTCPAQGPPGIWLEALTMVSEIYSKSILQHRGYRARMKCVLILSLESLQDIQRKKNRHTGEGSREMLVLGWGTWKTIFKTDQLKNQFFFHSFSRSVVQSTDLTSFLFVSSFTFFFLFLVRTFKFYSLSTLQLENTVLSAIINNFLLITQIFPNI